MSKLTISVSPALQAVLNGFKPAIVYGNKTEDYWVCPKTGNFWSSKGRTLKRLTVSYNNEYAQVSVSINGKKHRCHLHRIVYFSLNTGVISTPPGVTSAAWKRTPMSVKRQFTYKYLINHIDHNKRNYNPKNLELATHKENADAAVRHYKNCKG